MTVEIRAWDTTLMESQGSGLPEYLDVLWRRKWSIILPTILGISLALVLSERQEPSYVSTSEVLVLPVRDPSSLAPAPILIENELRIADSFAVRELAQDRLAIEGEAAPTSVDNPPETQTLVFSSASSDPRFAQATADAYTDAYLEFRTRTQLENVDAAANALEEVIAQLNAEIADAREMLQDASGTEAADLQFKVSTLTTQVSEHQARLDDLELLRTAEVGEILAPASLPDSPSSPNQVKAVVLGGAVGFLVGLGLAFLRERLDPRVRGRDDLEEAADAPLLATVPWVRRPVRVGVSGGLDSDPRVAEAFRALRARILFAASQRPLHSLLITSPTQGEGKTTTAASLAVAMAEAGKRVVLVDADLHNRGLGAYFPGQDAIGFTDVLMEPGLLNDAITPTSVEHVSMVSSSSGALPVGGFSASAVHEIVKRLEAVADLVILDSTPVLSLSDALELAPTMEGVLMVVDVGTASWGEIEESARQLRSVAAPMVGVVATKVVPGRFHGYHHARYEDYERLSPRPSSLPDSNGETEHEPVTPREAGGPRRTGSASD